MGKFKGNITLPDWYQCEEITQVTQLVEQKLEART